MAENESKNYDGIRSEAGNYIEITGKVICVDDAMKRVSSADCGAISMFLGVTRDNCDGQGVVRLEYEAYTEMALKQMLSICRQARARWSSVVKIAIIHRIGLVPVSEPSVVIAVSSPHRHESLAAVGFLIDDLKANVAVWKKEVLDNGQAAWKENRECPWKTEITE